MATLAQMGSQSFLRSALHYLRSNSDRRAGIVKERHDLAEAMSEAGRISFAETRSPASLTNKAIIRDAFKQSLFYHLERTSRYVFSSATVGSSTKPRPSTRGVELVALLNRYPGLALLWEKQLRGWARFVSNFFHHATAFVNSCDIELTISGIETDLSDPHRNGRSVTRVTLSDNSCWYYKPRSGRQEAAWRDFIEVINSAGFVPTLRAAEVRVCRDHCWMPATPARPCGDAPEREGFDKRIGALLYVAHILRAVDLHAGNVVGCGEHPVLVDCESFFHPETRLPAGIHMEGRNSLHRTGMFVSGGQTGHWPLAVMSRCTRLRRAPMRIRRNVIQGFEAMHEFLSSQTDNRTLKAAQKRFQRLPTRHIHRPTSYYCLLLHESLTPAMLSEPTRRYKFLQCRLSDGLCSAETVQKEISQLLAGDIPIFGGPSAQPRRCLTDLEFSRALRELQSC